MLSSGEHEKELRGAETPTTNNRMELTAAIRALAALKRPCTVALYTDSQYVRKGITEWLPQWKARDWRTADKKPVKNVDLWQALEREIERHAIEWHWVKGHAGVPGNERADRLANEAIDEMLAGAAAGGQRIANRSAVAAYHCARRHGLHRSQDPVPARPRAMNARMQAVLDHGQYILGAECLELESSSPSTSASSIASARRAAPTRC